MSLVTMATGFGAPIALAPSWTPFHENSLNDLSSSWPMSVTMPILSPLPEPGMTPQAVTMSPTAAQIARRRFMSPSDLPLIASRGAWKLLQRDAGILVRCAGSGWQARHDAPDDVDEEHDVQAPAEHERGQRQRVVAGAQAQLDPDEQRRDDREHRGDRAETAELPRREEHAQGHRNRRLEHHRAGDVAKRDDVLAVFGPDETVGGLGELGGERCENEGHEQRVEVHRVREVLDERREEFRADKDRGERDERLCEHQPQGRARRRDLESLAVQERGEGEGVESLPLLGLLFDIQRGGLRRSQDHEQVDDVRGQEDPADVPLEEVQLSR